jgi:putative tryptophan/tyrosine transport system substrate-binding protein
MRRREFVTLLGGVAAALPLAAQAQQAQNKRPLVGFLGGASFETARPTIDPFLEGMRELGYVTGRSVDFEYRFADGNLARLPDLAHELDQMRPSVILAAVTPAASAARTAAPGVPIVCPLLSGADLARTDARPDQNVTGIRSWVDGLPAKLIELARELVPSATRIGVLVNVSGVVSPVAQEILALGPSSGAKLIFAEIRGIGDLEPSLHRLVSERVDAVVVPPDSLLFAQRQHLAKLAADAHLPAIYGIPEHVHAGGLASYGVDFKQNFRRAAFFVDKILKGTRPRDMPIEFPTKLIFAINLKAATALGLNLPPTLLTRADEVIE